MNVNGVTGFTCDVGDVEAMAQRGIEVLQSDEVLQKFKENAVNHAKTYDIHSVCPIYEAYYEEVIEKHLQSVV